MRILIIGGYGQFGTRLASLLQHERDLTIVIAGRNFETAQAHCRESNGFEAHYVPLKLDRMGNLPAQIGQTIPDIIVDASGPFQAYGDSPYSVIEYAISVGAHYLDLADGTDFVVGVARFEAQAKAASVSIVSGLSTYPALTSALLMHWQTEFGLVTSIRAGITPSPHSILGRSVIDSITSYAGKPVSGGRTGLTQGFKARICPPGRRPLDRLLFADVDVPDAKLLPRLFPDLVDVRNAAGTKPQILHLILMGLAHLVKWRLLPNLTLLSPLIHACQKHLNSGEHRSGMMVEATGLKKDGTQAQCSWHLVAQGDDGPLIPVIPAAIVIRKALLGQLPAPGARAGAGEVTLADYQSEFNTMAISSGFHDDLISGSVYERVLGSSYNDLPAPIQELHRPGMAARYAGMAIVERGRHPLASLVCAVFRFPKASQNVPVTVDLTANKGIETWTRTFGTHKMVSTQEAGTGRYERLMTERFGPFAIGIALLVSEGRLINVTHSWSLFGLPLPTSLLPGGHIYESAGNERFNFHVEITAPLLGRLVQYQGWLEKA